MEYKPTELEILKERAKKMGIRHHPSIGVEALKAKINEVMDNTKKEVAEEKVQQQAKAIMNHKMNSKAAVGKMESHVEHLRKEAARLVRIRVACMNPAKRDWEGEIFTVSNSKVGTFKKYVPFNAEEGWYVPNIIYKQLINRKCQVFYTYKNPNGEKVRKGKLIPEFSVEVLPDLTEKELKELAQRQAMAQGAA